MLLTLLGCFSDAPERPDVDSVVDLDADADATSPNWFYMMVR